MLGPTPTENFWFNFFCNHESVWNSNFIQDSAFFSIVHTKKAAIIEYGCYFIF